MQMEKKRRKETTKPWKSGDADVFCFEGHPLVHFVADDDQIVFDGDRCDSFELLTRKHLSLG